MANMTVTGAQACVADLLDDAGNTRWSTAQISLGLTACLSKCQQLYQENGGDRFDLETTGTTSATDGSLSISSVVPLLIKDVAAVVGSVTYRLPPKNKIRRGYTDATARSLLVLYAREYALSSTGSDPLVGVGAVAANSWPDFDNWVCAETAALIGSKDLEGARLQFLRGLADGFKETVIARPKIPGGYPWPRKEWSPMNDWIQWQWKPATSTLNTVRVAW